MLESNTEFNCARGTVKLRSAAPPTVQNTIADEVLRPSRLEFGPIASSEKCKIKTIASRRADIGYREWSTLGPNIP